MNDKRNNNDIFISYSRPDQESALRISEILANKGLQVWIDQWELIPGVPWEEVSLKAIENSSALVIMVSTSSLSKFQLTEATYGLILNKEIFPVLLPGATIDNLPSMLKELEVIDLRDGFDKESEILRKFKLIVEKISVGSIEHGQLPPGSRMSFTKNVKFTGRETDLIAILESFDLRNEEKTIQTTVVTGMGGIGKTQLAIEFCYRFGHYFKGVHWLTADQDIAAEIAECGLEMGLKPWPEAQEEQVRVTLAAWKGGGPRLVVLDHMEDLQVLQKWRPRLGGVKVLLTSRIGRWPAGLRVQVQRLGALQREESRALLVKLAPHLDRVDVDNLDKVAERYQDVPLGMHLAGSYLNMRPELSVGDYLTRLEKRGGVLKQARLPDWVGDDPAGYERNLWATFEVGVEALEDDEKLGNAALKMFLASGYCAANVRIPRKILSGMVAGGEGEAKIDPDLAIEKLVQVGLLELGETGLVAHPLLVEFARAVDEKEEDSVLPGLVSALGDLSYEALEKGLPERFKPLRPHMETAAKAAEKARLEGAGMLWKNLGSHLQNVAEYAGAKAAYERALAIDEAAFGPDHPNIASDVNNLGLVLQAQGDYAGAKAAYERALAIDEAAFGPDHPDVARDINNLGNVLQDQGDYAGAKAAFERALAIWEVELGPDHPNVATTVNNLGVVLKALGDYAGAKAAYERALAIDEAAFGPDHPNVATTVNNLGLVLQAQGDYAGAKAACERALAIWEKELGPDHPQVATGTNNLGALLQDLGDYAGAKAAFERALAIDEAAFGPDHPNVAIRVNNLGLVLQDLGDHAGAKAALERALAIWEKELGPDHPQVATGTNNLGLVLQAQGDYAGAKAAFERALAIDEAAFGPDHPNVATDVNNLGGVLQAQGDYAGAKAAFERALAIDEAAFGPDHPNVAIRVNNLGGMLKDLGDYAGAKAALERALAIWEVELGPDHPQVATGTNNLGVVLRALGDHAGAKAAYERALAIDEAAFGPDHPNVAIRVNNLGGVLRTLGDYAGAKAAFERALAIFEEELPADHPNILTVRGNIEVLEEEINRKS